MKHLLKPVLVVLGLTFSVQVYASSCFNSSHELWIKFERSEAEMSEIELKKIGRAHV